MRSLLGWLGRRHPYLLAAVVVYLSLPPRRRSPWWVRAAIVVLSWAVDVVELVARELGVELEGDHPAGPVGIDELERQYRRGARPLEIAR